MVIALGNKAALLEAAWRWVVRPAEDGAGGGGGLEGGPASAGPPATASVSLQASAKPKDAAATGHSLKEPHVCRSQRGFCAGRPQPSRV